MEKRTIVLNSEFEFRNCVIQNSKNVNQILVFDDKQHEVVFFYCFTTIGLVYTAKELSIVNFEKYKNYYKRLATECGLCIFPGTSQLITAKI